MRTTSIALLAVALAACAAPVDVSPSPPVGDPAATDGCVTVQPLARQFGAFRRRPHPIVDLGMHEPTTPRLQSLAWTGAAPAADPTLIVDGGDLDLEGTAHAAVASESADGQVLFTATSSEGVLSFRFNVPSGTNSTATLRVRGVDVLTMQESFPTTTTQQWRVGDDLSWRVWYRPSTGQCGIRLAVNGVILPDVVGSTSGGALVAPTSATVGTSIADASVAQTFYANLKTYVPVATTPEIVVIGDSTIAPFYSTAMQGPNVGLTSGLVSVAHDVYTSAQRLTRPGIGILAVPSDTTNGQRAKFDASPWSSQGTVAAVIVEVGINDRSAGAPTVAGYVQTLVDDVRAKLPSTKILVAKLVPYTLYDGTTTFLFAFNDDVMGTGANPITGVDGRISAHYAALDNGSGGYQPAYNFDQIHENNAGRALVSAAYKTALQGAGVLP